MADFKLCIADPKTGKTYQKEVKDNDAQPFIGMKIDEPVKGELVGLTGYELLITGGSDYCGFPMRRGILGIRKKVTLLGGIGFKGGRKGMKKRKTVCGHKINKNIVQINLKVTKEGSKKLADVLGVKEEAKKEKKETKEKPKEEKKEEVKKETKEEPKKEEKPKEAPKKEEKKEESKKEAPKEEQKKPEKK